MRRALSRREPYGSGGSSGGGARGSLFYVENRFVLSIPILVKSPVRVVDVWEAVGGRELLGHEVAVW
jgi:hypothetical protein